MTTGIVVLNGIHYLYLLPQSAMCSNFLWLHDLSRSLTALICPGDCEVKYNCVGYKCQPGSVPVLMQSPRLRIPGLEALG